MEKRTKAIILFSGGLDSILAAKILEEQGIKLLGITFKSYFFNEKQAKKTAKEIKLPLKIIDFSEEHLKIVKEPKYGYGKAMNPCIDCHILMLKVAKQIAVGCHPERPKGTKDLVSHETLRFAQGDPALARKGGVDFIATGDVLGERPMSQNRQALEIIEKESGLTDYLLRPLSAKLLKPTIPEKLGWVSRNKLLDIQGRSRKRQIALAKKYKIREYPTPAGGCLLTDLEFGKRLKELLKICSKCDGNDIELLKYGRHPLLFVLAQKEEVKIVVGRNEEENKKIKKLKKKKDILIEMKNYVGPLTLIRNYGKGEIPQRIIEKAKNLTQYYSTKARHKKDVKFKIKILD